MRKIYTINVAAIITRGDGGTASQIETLILGARAPLMSNDVAQHTAMLRHLGTLLDRAADHGVKRILHISSVAAVNHLRAQRGESEEDPLPPLDEYQGQAYDLYKRGCEDAITEACERRGLRHVHVRLSAVFSNDPSCIQVNAIASMARVGCYLPVLLDCNSSRNVCVALRLLLQRLEDEPERVRQVYYYTRPWGPPVPCTPPASPPPTCLLPACVPAVPCRALP